MTPNDVKSILAVARISTHVQLKRDGLWRRILRVEDTINGDISVGDPVDRESVKLIYVNMNAVNDFEFANLMIQPVPIPKLNPLEQFVEVLRSSIESLKRVTAGPFGPGVRSVVPHVHLLDCVGRDLIGPFRLEVVDDVAWLNMLKEQGITEVTAALIVQTRASITSFTRMYHEDCTHYQSEVPGFIKRQIQTLEIIDRAIASDANLQETNSAFTRDIRRSTPIPPSDWWGA